MNSGNLDNNSINENIGINDINMVNQNDQEQMLYNNNENNNFDTMNNDYNEDYYNENENIDNEYNNNNYQENNNQMDIQDYYNDNNEEQEYYDNENNININNNMNFNQNNTNELNDVYSINAYGNSKNIIFNDDFNNNPLQIQIINLQKRCIFLNKQNANLKNLLKQQKLNEQSKILKEQDYEMIENSIKQSTILLDDVKSKNYSLNQKIKELEQQNKDLNHQIIELNLKLKNILNKTNNDKRNENGSIQVSDLNNKIEENEILISKLKFDNLLLENKLEDSEKSHENDIKLMLDYKNSELLIYKKFVDNIKNNEQNINNEISSNNINYYMQRFNEYEIKMNSLSNDLMIVSLDKKKLQNENSILKTNLNSKNKIILSLNNKLNEINQSSNENINLTKEQVDQLIREREELIRKNDELTNGILNLNSKIKEANLIFNKKMNYYNKNLMIYKNKIKEYKKIIDELNSKLNNNFNQGLQTYLKTFNNKNPLNLKPRLGKNKSVGSYSYTTFKIGNNINNEIDFDNSYDEIDNKTDINI